MTHGTLALGRRTLAIAEEAVARCGMLPKDSPSKRAIFFFATKIVRSFDSVLILHETRHVQDAETVTRTILEAYAKTCYIQQSPDQDTAAKQFFDHMLKKTAKVFKRVEKYPTGEFPDLLKTVDPEGKIRALEFTEPLWPEKQVPEIMAAIGTQLLPGCREWYDALSDYVHSNGRIVEEYLDFKRDFRPYAIGGAPQHPNTHCIDVRNLCSVVMMTIESLCQRFDQPLPRERAEIISWIKRLQGTDAPGESRPI